MLYGRGNALRRISEFFDEVPYALMAAGPDSRHAAERRPEGVRVAGNILRSRRVSATTGSYEQITCVVEDPLGLVLARWWLRKRSVPELMGEDAQPASTADGDSAGKVVLLKNCRLYLRCVGGASTQASPYILSLGDIATLGIVDRIDMINFPLQPTCEQLVPYLRAPAGLQTFRLRHVKANLNELLTLLAANVATLKKVELTGFQLPMLQLLAYLPGVRELEMRNAELEGDGLVTNTHANAVGESSEPTSTAEAATRPEVGTLMGLAKLDLSGLRSRLDLSWLGNCQSLKLLNLSSSTLTNEGVLHIAQLQSLQDLFLSSTSVSDVTALSGCTALQYLQLTRTKVDSAGIASLGTLENFTQLDVSYTKVDRLDGISRSKSLTILNIWRTRVDTDTFRTLGNLTTLHHLIAGDNDIRDVNCLATCAELRRLNLQSTTVSASGISGLLSLTELEELNLSHTPIESVSCLKEMASLKSLDLTGTRVTADGLCDLRILPLLESITITKSDVENVKDLTGSACLREIVGKRCRLATLEGMNDIPKLDTLIATHCTVSSVEPLRGCKELQVLNLWGCELTQEGLTGMDECPKLREVDLAETGVTNITPLLECIQMTALVLYSTPLQSIEGIGALARLTRLDVANTSVVDLSPLVHCSALEILNVSDTSIDDAGFRGVEQLSALTAVLLSSTRVTHIGQLGLCSHLVDLHAGKSPITSAGIAGLERARKIRKLNLSYTEVESGTTALAWCRRLEKLNLKFTKVPTQDLEALRRYLPKCRISAF